MLGSDFLIHTGLCWLRSSCTFCSLTHWLHQSFPFLRSPRSSLAQVIYRLQSPPYSSSKLHFLQCSFLQQIMSCFVLQPPLNSSMLRWLRSCGSSYFSFHRPTNVLNWCTAVLLVLVGSGRRGRYLTSNLSLQSNSAPRSLNFPILSAPYYPTHPWKIWAHTALKPTLLDLRIGLSPIPQV